MNDVEKDIIIQELARQLAKTSLENVRLREEVEKARSSQTEEEVVDPGDSKGIKERDLPQDPDWRRIGAYATPSRGRNKFGIIVGIDKTRSRPYKIDFGGTTQCYLHIIEFDPTTVSQEKQTSLSKVKATLRRKDERRKRSGNAV